MGIRLMINQTGENTTQLKNYLKELEPQGHRDTYAIGQGLGDICTRAAFPHGGERGGDGKQVQGHYNRSLKLGMRTGMHRNTVDKKEVLAHNK